MSELNVLVVDDEEAIRDVLQMVLEKAGMNVTAVSSAEQARDYLAKAVVDLILLDWMLPGISGVELTRRLKNDDGFKKLSIILLTARSEAADKTRAFEAGVDDFMTKPFSPKELITRIKSVVSNKAIRPMGSTQ